MSRTDLVGRVADYYAGKLARFGATPAGVDWNSAESQTLRFRQLLQLVDDDTGFTVLDYGCGYGALWSHLRAAGVRCQYVGYDVAGPMVDAARREHARQSDVQFVDDRDCLTPADYCVASGIFNVKLATSDDHWDAYMKETLADMAALSRKGFAFNVLTSYSDPERRRADLYYADPLAMFDHCKRTFSPRVALLHDYPLYEFTVLVRFE
jgi:SAM-dependent methyltransferase